ncbi:sensor histidine kinase [Flavobacterium sp.]|uniref:sensor histidine kinase n=1 Tax=Flavobacterium sp. TaxID=239 RepID=UPI003D6C2567
MRAKLLYILFFLAANLAFAQQPVTIQLTEKDGLPDIEFYDLLEDNNGFIWLAADKGLYRYDGKFFVNYTHPEKRGLSVFGLFEDEKGRIWCNTISGQFFYAEKGKLTLFTDLKEELKGQLPEFIVQRQHLIAFSEKGIFKIDIDTKKQIIIKDQTSKSPYYGSPFQYNNHLYFTLTNQIKTFERNKIGVVFTFNKGEIEPKNNAFCNLGSTFFFSSLFDNQQHFFLKSTNSNAFKTIKVPTQLLDKTIVRVEEKDGLMWFCTNQGIIVCSWNDTEIEYKNTYLPNEYITKIIKDKNDNFWFSTLRNGVFVMPNIYIKKLQLPGNISHVTTMATVDQSRLVFGTPNGKIGLFDSNTFQTTLFSLLSDTKVSQIIYNHPFKTLFISQESQSYLWNLKNNTIRKNPYFTASKKMAITQNNSLLNACYDRVSIMQNPFGKASVSSDKIQFGKPVFSTKEILFPVHDIRMKRAYTCFYNAESNTNYVGFVDDLIAFDSKNKPTVIRYKNQPVFAIDIEETNDGTLWISTFKDGILGIRNKKVAFSFTTANGLLSNQTGKLKSDKNQLWITTEQGIQVLNTKTGAFKNITKNDGLESYSISDIEILGNHVYLSSNKGIFIIEKVKSFKSPLTPKIYFTGVQIQEKDTLLQSGYQLTFDKNAIKISFNSNGFQTSESIRYQYRLIGLNNKWLPLEKGTDFVLYSSLPPGNFIFQVEAINQSGITSAPISMNIVVGTPFWQKWWFYVALSLSLVLLVWLYFKSRLRRFEKEKRIELEKAETDKELLFSQLENLRSQMNPHFIFNALNSIQEYIVTNEKETASAFLVKFSRLIRIYLEHSRESEVQLEEELKALRLYLELEKDRFEDALEYSIVVDKQIDFFTTKIPSLFIQPYIENALKHGLLHKKNNRKLDVSFLLNENKDSITCIITDNGIGRKAAEALNNKRAHLHKSFATNANQKRVELINKTRPKKTSVEVEDLYDDDNPIGTRVSIVIPL